MESLPFTNKLCSGNKNIYEEHWFKCKSLANITRQNLNTDFKEKEVNYKLNLDEHCNKDWDCKSYNQKINQRKPQCFIDNKMEPSFCSTSRIRNKDSNKAVVATKGLGRGEALQRRVEALGPANNLYCQYQYNSLHGIDRSGDSTSMKLASTIKNQVQEVMGDLYSDRALRKSLEELSSYQKGPSCGLERTLSEISLVSNSRSSQLGNDSEIASSTSDDGSVINGGNAILHGRALRPPSGACVPGSGACAPGSGAYAPGCDDYIPESEDYIPKSGVYMPESGAYTLGSGAYVPGGGAYASGSEDYMPESGAYMPGSGASSSGPGVSTWQSSDGAAGASNSGSTANHLVGGANNLRCGANNLTEMTFNPMGGHDNSMRGRNSSMDQPYSCMGRLNSSMGGLNNSSTSRLNNRSMSGLNNSSLGGPNSTMDGLNSSMGGAYNSICGTLNSIGGASSQNTTMQMGDWVPCETHFDTEFNIADHEFPALK